MAGDELTLYSSASDTRLIAYFQNNLTNITSRADFWTTIYKVIYISNLSIEGLNNSTVLSPLLKQQLLGEAKFIRAFCYFYLVNLYGDVPLAITTDYTLNNVLSRSPQAQVWAQIIQDLDEAQLLLSPEYLDGTAMKGTTERIRPTKWAAKALLARSYLYTKNWKKAELLASEIIDNSTLYKLETLDHAFLINNTEAIWQLQPVNINSNTEDAKVYIILSAGPSINTPAYLNSQLLNSFEANDQRKKIWIDSISVSGKLYFYAYKYKSGTLGDPLTEYKTVLGLGEQYLIRSEARAEEGELEGARDDLNIIRKRAGLNDISLTQQSQLLEAVYHERQVELFTEWGHRWLDLKRTGKIDQVMSIVTPTKGGSWNSNWQLFPIPSDDILTNGNLAQNKGY